MKATEVLLQGECIPDIQVVELGVDGTVKDLLEAAAKCRAEAIEGDFFVFVEGSAEPIADGTSCRRARTGSLCRFMYTVAAGFW